MSEPAEQASSAMRRYTPEDDARIVESIQIAEDMGVPMSAVYSRLADDLDRSEKAIEVRINLLKRKARNEDESSDDDEEEDGHESVLTRLKALIKERDMYKRLYENGEEKVKDYDRMARELRKIRRVLGE